MGSLEAIQKLHAQLDILQLQISALQATLSALTIRPIVPLRTLVFYTTRDEHAPARSLFGHMWDSPDSEGTRHSGSGILRGEDTEYGGDT